ncbi:MAG TPA: NAD(P)/FAD-dependent oxidoreductase [Tepidisphaeraceae bacterium]|jgi:flavin-dependent dehydrogenase
MLTASDLMKGAEIYDAIVIGGGPAGSIAALALAKRGRKVIVLEKAVFPRFHIGESFLPATFDRLKELGLEPALRKLPHVPKFGAEFAMGNGGTHLEIQFEDGFCPGAETFNIERSLLDKMLLEEAARAGAEVRQPAIVKQIISMADGDVRIQTDSDEIRGRYLLDCSGQQTVIGRHLGTRKNADEPHLKKIAYFSQFENVWRPPGIKDGQPLIAMMDEGWFWMIPLNERVTSVGVVLDAEVARNVLQNEKIKPDQMLAWGIDRCPAVKERMTKAVGRPMNNVLADFSYSCRPYAGRGYFLIGDAATFMDPIFSTGVSVAVNGAMAVAKYVDDIIAGRITAARARTKYIAHLEESTGTLFQIIRQYYDHSFRELFMNGTGPLQVHKAVIGVLAGNVFPRPPWKLRWRLRFFDFLVKWNRKRQLVPRRRRFSLLKSNPAPVDQSASAGLEQSIPAVAEIQAGS